MSLSAYKYLIVVFYRNSNNEEIMVRDVLFNTPTLCSLGVNANGYRQVSASRTSVKIGDYKEYDSYNGAKPTSYNQYSIPYQIYGVK